MTDRDYLNEEYDLGYRDGIVIEGPPTYIFFPIGESERLFFLTYGEKGPMVTSYIVQGSRAMMVWQVKLIPKEGKSKPFSGSLAKVIEHWSDGNQLPALNNPDYLKWSARSQEFAKYYIDIHRNSVSVYFVESNGNQMEDQKAENQIKGNFAMYLEKKGFPIPKREDMAVRQKSKSSD